MRTVLTLVAAGIAGQAVAQDSDPKTPEPGFTELTIIEAEVVSVLPTDDWLTVEVRYTAQNTGTTTIDMHGEDPDSANDNSHVQTYIASDADLIGPAYAAGGSAIFDPEVLEPGDTYEGVYFANTGQTPNPTDTAANPFAVIDVYGVAGTPAVMGINRVVLPIPEWCRADFAAPAGVLNIDDVLGFLDAFAQGHQSANIASSYDVLDVDDVLEFLAVFAAGCDL